LERKSGYNLLGVKVLNKDYSVCPRFSLMRINYVVHPVKIKDTDSKSMIQKADLGQK
jgi:hypothetical protein